MLIGRIRPVETRTLTLHGDTAAEIREQAERAAPDGWEVAVVPIAPSRGPGRVSSVVTIVRRDGVRDIEAADHAALERLVPAGWQLLSVRRT